MGSGKSKEASPTRDSTVTRSNNSNKTQSTPAVNGNQNVNGKADFRSKVPDNSTKNSTSDVPKSVRGPVNTKFTNDSQLKRRTSIDSLERDLELDNNWNHSRPIANTTLSSDNNRSNVGYSQSETFQEGGDEEEYPETYAQRKLREQYTRKGLIRQKTILRDPDEWNDCEEEEEPRKNDFDIEKFKAVNRHKKSEIEREADTKNDENFYGHEIIQYSPRLQTKQQTPRVIPQYDDKDEDLIADIEREFDL